MTGSGGVDREDTEFVSGDARCAAWLFRPTDSSRRPLPIIVMAHGFAAHRSFALPRYAQKFANRGMAVLVFDYRHLGDSEGQPRDLIDHRRQHQDWLAAIRHARSIEGIDDQRVGLWGSSYSGGHVICIAANNPEVAAIVSQAPMVDGLTAVRVKPKQLILATAHALVDLARATFGRSPHYVPVVGPPTQFASLNGPGCQEGYYAQVPADSDWQNRCTARSLLTTLAFRPSRHAHAAQCPALVVIPTRDQVIRSTQMEKVAARLPHGQVLRYDVDHFQIYEGDVFEDASNRQADFFAEHLVRASA